VSRSKPVQVATGQVALFREGSAGAGLSTAEALPHDVLARQSSEGANVQRVRRVRSGDDIHPLPAGESATIMALLIDTDRARDGPSDMPPRSGLIDQAVITTAHNRRHPPTE
jgi:hypothetical protein